MIARCLRKDAGRRFQHMADVKVALEELKEESESGGLLHTASLAQHGGAWRVATQPYLVGASAERRGVGGTDRLVSAHERQGPGN